MIEAGVIYLIFVALWFGFFLKLNAFNNRRVGSWIGAICASLVWPLGFLLVGYEMRKQKKCKHCKQLNKVYEEHAHKVFGK